MVGFGARSKTPEGPASSASRKVAGPCNRTWAELMRRGLEIEVLQCPDCGGRLRYERRADAWLRAQTWLAFLCTSIPIWSMAGLHCSS